MAIQPFLRGSAIGNQQGNAIIMAMIMLCLLTIIGVAAINTSTIETLVSKSEMETQEAFYAADGGVQYALEQIANSISPAGTYDSGDGLNDATVTIDETQSTNLSITQRSGSSLSFGDNVLTRYTKIYTISAQSTTTGSKTLEAQASADVWEPR